MLTTHHTLARTLAVTREAKRFSQLFALSNPPTKPGSDVDVRVDAVLGKRVKLMFTGHESIACGGFSERIADA
ncbi:MAG: hypothetical protein ACPGUV_01315 [Polyangiales bacterium]